MLRVTNVDNLDKRVSIVGDTAVATVRLKYGEFYADIIPDRLGSDSLWIYVVQRHGSPEILAMGACSSQEHATETATAAINELRADARSHAAS